MFCGQTNSFRNKQIETLFGLRNARIDFRHFVQLAASIPNHHWEQSVKFLPLASDNKLVLDVLGTFDRIEESVAEISKKSRLKLGLTRKNTTSHKHYTRYYDSGTIELVASMFADDIAILGFEFGRI